MPTNLCLVAINNTTFKVDEIEGAGATALPDLWGYNDAMPEGPSPSTTTGEFEVLGTTFTATGERGQYSVESNLPNWVAPTPTGVHDIELYADQACTQRPSGSVTKIYAKLNRPYGFGQSASLGNNGQCEVVCPSQQSLNADYALMILGFLYQIERDYDYEYEALIPGVYELTRSSAINVDGLQYSFGDLVDNTKAWVMDDATYEVEDEGETRIIHTFKATQVVPTLVSSVIEAKTIYGINTPGNAFIPFVCRNANQWAYGKYLANPDQWMKEGAWTDLENYDGDFAEISISNGNGQIPIYNWEFANSIGVSFLIWLRRDD